MSVLIRLSVAAAITCLCQVSWAQYPVEFPTEVSAGFPVEGTIVNEGVVYEGAMPNGTEYPIQSGQIIENVNTVSYNAPIQSSGQMSSGGGILDVVNSKRSRSGLRPLMFDAGLTQIAQNKSNIRANRGITGHDSTSRGHARVEGVGYAYGGNLTQRFNTCYLYANGYSHAGAAISYDRSGRAFYTLLLR